MKLLEKIKALFIGKPKKLGIALGSGGAKGMALIGALKAFEEYGIKFDMVAGTSIGSIIGGLYASGHDTTEMLDFLKEYDVTNPKTLIMMKLRGVTVEQILDQVVGGRFIEELKMPYYAVSVDVNSGEKVVMHEGSLSKAMACSSAIPPVFKPVARENRKLLDGALVDSVPADILKQNGADTVISISLTEEPENTKTKEVIDKLYKGNGVQLCNRIQMGIDNSDVWIEPNLKEFNSASIFGLKEMYAKGYEATILQMPQILELLEKKKFIKNSKKRR